MMRRLFAPSESLTVTGIALLVLRAWLGLTLLMNHGLEKLQTFGTLKGDFPDPLGVGHTTSLALALFAEFLCSLLLITGMFTRLAALALVVNMGVAFFMVHRLALSGSHSGELAFIYLAGFVTILLAGPGKFSSDQWLNARSLRVQEAKKG